jgi:hypothetical protein
MRVCKTCEKVLDNSMFHPCKTGKDGLRIVCKSCVSASQREYGRKHAAEISVKNKLYREGNKEKLKAKDAAYYVANKERVNATNRAWYAANKDSNKAYVRLWQLDNPEKVAEYKQRSKLTRPDTVKAEYERNKAAYFARAAMRRTLVKQAVPKWASGEELVECYEVLRYFNSIYPNHYHLDHIVPIKSKLVCGLHTPDNLRLVTAKENLSKNNRYWPNMA